MEIRSMAHVIILIVNIYIEVNTKETKFKFSQKTSLLPLTFAQPRFLKTWPDKKISDCGLSKHHNGGRESGLNRTVSTISSNYPIVSSNTNLSTFIHIPKTGGESIELSLLSVGIAVSRYAYVNLTKVANYKRPTVEIRSFPTSTDKSLKSCSKWHLPPAEFVPKSITIVRHPIKRMISEFCFRTSRRQNLSGINCAGFNTYINSTMTRILVHKKRDVEDCHWLPQWEFAKYSQTILPFSAFNESYFWNTISDNFGIKARNEETNGGTSCIRIRIGRGVKNPFLIC
eukprot:gene7697-15752_t